MGIHGLWELVAPTAKLLPIANLNGYKVAVDASIWIAQFISAMTDENGNTLKAAHIIGFLKRILRLYAYNVFPIFVFDGTPPTLKFETLKKRLDQRRKDEIAFRRATDKLIKNFLERRLNNKNTDFAQMDNNKLLTAIDILVKCRIPDNFDKESKIERLLNEEEKKLQDQLRVREQQNKKIRTNPLKTVDLCVGNSDDAYEIEILDDDNIPTIFRFNNIDCFTNPLFNELDSKTHYKIITEMRELLFNDAKSKIEAVAEDIENLSKVQVETYMDACNYNSKLNETRKILGDEHFKSVQSQKMSDSTLVSDQLSVENEFLQILNSEINFYNELSNVSNENLDKDESENDNLLPPNFFFKIRKKNFRSSTGRIWNKIRYCDTEKYISKNAAWFNDTSTTNKANHVDSQNKFKIVNDINFELRNDWEDALMKTLEFNKNDSNTNETNEVQQELIGLNINSILTNKNDRNQYKSQMQYKHCEIPSPIADKEIKNNSIDQIDKYTNISNCAITNFSKLNLNLNKNEAHIDRNNKYENTVSNDTFNYLPDCNYVSNYNSPSIINNVDNKLNIDYQMNTTNTTCTHNNNFNKDNITKNDIITNNTEDKPAQTTNDNNTTSTTKYQHSYGGNMNTEQHYSLYDQSIENDKEDSIGSVENSLIEKIMNKKDHGLKLDDTTEEKLLELLSINKDQKNAILSISLPDEQVSANTEVHINHNSQLLANYINLNSMSFEEKIYGATKDSSNLGNYAILDQNLSMAEEKAYEVYGIINDDIKSKLYNDIRQLLTLLGIPWINAPGEAEAEASRLSRNNIVDAVISEDSDCLAFEANVIIRKLFLNKGKVELYSLNTIYEKIGLSKQMTIALACLVGCDYTVGVSGIGIVNALETIIAFGDTYDALKKFGNWGRNIMDVSDPHINVDDSEILIAYKQQHKNYRRFWRFPPDFPDINVFNEFSKPSTATTTIPLMWDKPLYHELRKFLVNNTMLSTVYIDKTVSDIEEYYTKLKRLKQQTKLTDYMSYSQLTAAAECKSKRILSALKNFKQLRSVSNNSKKVK